MNRNTQHIAAFGSVLLLAAAPGAWAQQAAPFGLLNPDKPAPSAITTPQSQTEQNGMLTTKPAGEAAPALPWQQPVTVAAPGTQAMPAAIPFGKSTASQYQPIQESPHTATAVPVENVDSTITTSAPAPATPPADIADPAHEDPTAPTELTSPIFSAQETQIPRTAEVSVLNKVTARAQTIIIRPGATERVGRLNITVSHCQLSAENSLPDAAALFEISENIPDQKAPKPLFSGWLYQSSPSVSALEHPVYDVTLLGCTDTTGAKKPAETDKKTKKK